MLPYTARVRLRADFDLSTLPNDYARTVARALQKYGMFLDDGGNIPLTFDTTASNYIGSHDLSAIAVTDFELISSPDPVVPLTDNCTRTPITE
jgi:serine/threonine-protein kinase